MLFIVEFALYHIYPENKKHTEYISIAPRIPSTNFGFWFAYSWLTFTYVEFLCNNTAKTDKKQIPDNEKKKVIFVPTKSDRWNEWLNQSE